MFFFKGFQQKIFTPCVATKLKNKSVEYGFVVKTRVILNAELIVVHTPENLNRLQKKLRFPKK